ncbi:hypothetical protein [Saccharothrix deserti]|uniref:hypothetical protein n=1 Tax=Saccharothrix deserti TaxID=2593674 RepID=UPI00192E62F2|nr:hypothetical protein [Saccharothrix deserti]
MTHEPRRRATTAATVLDNGPVARSTIARLTGLSAAAVTRQYAELGLLCEVHTRVPRATLGRPHVPVDVERWLHRITLIDDTPVGPDGRESELVAGKPFTNEHTVKVD